MYRSQSLHNQKQPGFYSSRISRSIDRGQSEGTHYSQGIHKIETRKQGEKESGRGEKIDRQTCRTSGAHSLEGRPDTGKAEKDR